MNKIRILAQCYVDLMIKLGLVRFSLLLASILVILAILAQTAVTLLYVVQSNVLILSVPFFWSIDYALDRLFSVCGNLTIGRIKTTVGSFIGYIGNYAFSRLRT